MYLDPGSIGMLIQGLFALAATALAFLRIPSKLLAAARRLWARVRG